MTVGFVGLGAMGLPMARRLLGAGHQLVTTVHRSRGPAEALEALGATIAGSPAGDVARAADVVITIVPADRELLMSCRGTAACSRDGRAARC